jgi:NAD+ synthetase
MATGYCTLYGDMAGGFAVIKDVLKTTVFKLARWRNANDPFGKGMNPIPERIITRPAQRRTRARPGGPGQLPPYDILDGILSRYMENDQGVDDIVAAGYDAPVVERVAKLVRINEYKRRQAPVGIRVTHRDSARIGAILLPASSGHRPGLPDDNEHPWRIHEADHRHRQALQAGGGQEGLAECGVTG